MTNYKVQTINNQGFTGWTKKYSLIGYYNSITKAIEAMRAKAIEGRSFFGSCLIEVKREAAKDFDNVKVYSMTVKEDKTYFGLTVESDAEVAAEDETKANEPANNKEVEAYLTYLGTLRKGHSDKPQAIDTPVVPAYLRPVAAKVEGELELPPEIEAMIEASAARINHMFSNHISDM